MDYQQLAKHLLRDEGPHSSIYVEGLCAALKLRIEGELGIINYPEGSVECDAYYHGCRRGADEFSNALVEANYVRAVAIETLGRLASERRAV